MAYYDYAAGAGKHEPPPSSSSGSGRDGSSTSRNNNNNGTSFATSNLPNVVRCCRLDEDGCLTLEDILTSFQTAINEEQAWALCYLALKCFAQHFRPGATSLVIEPSHLAIHKDGLVHPKTLIDAADQRRQEETVAVAAADITSKSSQGRWTIDCIESVLIVLEWKCIMSTVCPGHK